VHFHRAIAMPEQREHHATGKRDREDEEEGVHALAAIALPHAPNERGKAVGGYAPALECGSPPLLGLMARRETRFVRCAHSARTIATSQSTKRADARGHEPCAARRRICR